MGARIAKTVAYDAERLREAVQRSGLSDRALAVQAGVPRTTVIRMLAGESKKVGRAHLNRLADELGVSVSWLRAEEPDWWLGGREESAAGAEARIAERSKRFARTRDPSLEAGEWGDRLEVFLGGRGAMARRRAREVEVRVRENTKRQVRIESKRQGRAGWVLIGSFRPEPGKGPVIPRRLVPHTSTEALEMEEYLLECKRCWLRGEDLPESRW